jgi:hypothetical protein
MVRVLSCCLLPFSRRGAACCVACLWLCGCAPEAPGFTEVKLVHERITSAEWASFVRIIERLPERRAPAIPKVYLPPPQWETQRTLPVRELYQEELRRREECWDASRVAMSFERHQQLMRELRAEKLTAEQFAGLLLTVCAAASRSTLADDVDLAQLCLRARPHLEELARDQSTFATLPPETQYVIEEKAKWIVRKVVADKLRQVPPENLALVNQHREWLERVLAEEFFRDPLTGLRDRLEEEGVPFEETPESGYDEEIRAPQTAGRSSRECIAVKRPTRRATQERPQREARRPWLALRVGADSPRPTVIARWSCPVEAASLRADRCD